MSHANPYAAALGHRDPLEALADTPWRIEETVKRWRAEEFERPWSPGKWTGRQILIHLAQTELALTTRARFALSEDAYAAQSFSQDAWMPLDATLGAPEALDAYLAMRRMNLAMWRSLTAAQRERSFSHPEYGTLTVHWIAEQLAGHEIHHYRQLSEMR